jgi:hypothetical protein
LLVADCAVFASNPTVFGIRCCSCCGVGGKFAPLIATVTVVIISDDKTGDEEDDDD